MTDEREVLFEMAADVDRIERHLNAQPDLATRVAADIFVRWIGGEPGSGDEPSMPTDAWIRYKAKCAIHFGRIFAEAVAKEGK